MTRSNQRNGGNSRNGNNRRNGGRNNGNGGNQNHNRNGNSGNGGTQRTSQPTKALLRMKQSKRNDHTIKANFTNGAGDEIKELLQTYSDGDPKDLLIELEKQLIKLAKRYGKFSDGSWEQLVDTFARCLEGRIETIWCDKAEDITHAAVGNADAQERKCKAFIQAVNLKYLGKNAADDQKDAMSDGELHYEGHDHEKAAERLFQINKDLGLLNANVEPFSTRDMIRKMGLPKNLKAKARLRYIDKGGKELDTADEAIELCLDIKEYLNEEIAYENEKRSREQKNRGNGNSGNARNNDTDRSSDKPSSDSSGEKKSNPCRRHDGKHDWNDCPDNWKNQNKGSTDKPKKSSDKKEVTSTEDDSCANSNFMVQSDDESVSDSSHSSNEFMDIMSSKPSESLHPITVIAAPDKEGKRTAAKILLDQCCTDQGLISFNFANKLGLPKLKADKDLYLSLIHI